MTDRMCAEPRIRTSEFQIVLDPITKDDTREFGLCGEDADASSLSSSLGRTVTVQETYSYMRNHGTADLSGASTLSGNLACCLAFGAVVVDQLDYNANLPWATILAFLRQHAGINPIVYETSKGQAQVDSISGQGENAVNLQYHFPAVLGYHPGGASDQAGGRVLPEGIWVADGCSFAGGNSNANGFNAANVLQFYTMAVIEAAALVGLFALKGRDVTLTISQASVFFAANADGSWHCKQTGMTLRAGMLQFYQNFVGAGSLNGLTDFGLPITNEINVGSVDSKGVQPTIQVFERCAVMYDPERVIDTPPDAMGDEYKAHMNRPEVLKALAVALPPVPAPTVSFGTPQDSQANGVLTISLPFTVK